MTENTVLKLLPASPSKLLQGSHNIDRMRKEVEELVSMVSGLAKQSVFLDEQYGEVFESEKCRWEVRAGSNLEHGGIKRHGLLVQCFIKMEGGGYYGGYSSNPNCFIFSNKNVQIVHEDLQTFLDGMKKIFPKLAFEWQFILNAAEVEL